MAFTWKRRRANTELGPIAQTLASGTLRYFTSPNFTTAYTVQLGSHLAIVL